MSTEEKRPAAPELDYKISQLASNWRERADALALTTHAAKLAEVRQLEMEIGKAKGIDHHFDIPHPRDTDMGRLEDLVTLLHYIQYEAPRFMDLFCDLAIAAKKGELAELKASKGQESVKASAPPLA